MKRIHLLLSKLSLVIFLLVLTVNTIAQLPGIAIINLSDSTLIHKHLGVTMFTNSTDTFDLQLDYKIENFLTNSFLVTKDIYDAVKLSKTE